MKIRDKEHNTSRFLNKKRNMFFLRNNKEFPILADLRLLSNNF